MIHCNLHVRRVSPSMMDEHVDLCDRRRRLVRLALVIATSAVITALVMRGIIAVSRSPNADPIGGSIVGLVAFLVFVLTSLGLQLTIDALARRAARRSESQSPRSG